MIWQPEIYLPIFKAWASRFPVREPNVKIKIRKDITFRESALVANKTRREAFLADMAARGETIRQRKSRQSRESKARRKAKL